MANTKNYNITRKIDWLLLLLYICIVLIGIMTIFLVDYKFSKPWYLTFADLKYRYTKQLFTFFLGLIIGGAIILIDASYFTSLAVPAYVMGMLLMFSTFVVGKVVNGSRSWLPIAGGFNLQPAELCKIFTALLLAKYIAQQHNNFKTPRKFLIAGAIVLFPAMIANFQHELGLAIVYAAFFIVMFREGLSVLILLGVFFFSCLTIASLIIEPNILAIIVTLLFLLIGLIVWKQTKKNRRKIVSFLVIIWLASVSFQRVVVPYIFNYILECYQSTRIYSMIGKDYDCSKNHHLISTSDKVYKKPDNYNVKQSMIAIGSGGLWGKGFFQGTQTLGRYVPEQHTDFIFTSIGETFGFMGSSFFLLIYFLFLFRLLVLAERQRSTFSRVYIYSVACIILMHVMINIGMDIGLFPVVGIPLPLISYGGSSLLTNSILVFLVLRLDMDRQNILS